MDDAFGVDAEVDVEVLSLTAEHAPRFWKGVLRADCITTAIGVDTSLYSKERDRERERGQRRGVGHAAAKHLREEKLKAPSGQSLKTCCRVRQTILDVGPREVINH